METPPPPPGPVGAAQEFARAMAERNAAKACMLAAPEMRVNPWRVPCAEIFADFAKDENYVFVDRACVNDAKNYEAVREGKSEAKVYIRCKGSKAGRTWLQVKDFAGAWAVININTP